MRNILTFVCLFVVLVAASAKICKRSKKKDPSNNIIPSSNKTIYRSNYCNLYCKDHWTQQYTPHIGCSHNQNFSPRCYNTGKLVEMKDSFKKLLVDLHNENRNLIAGGGDINHDRACHMATMKWDEELEYLATLNVKQCSMEHDHCHNTDAFQFSGQNLYLLADPYAHQNHKFNDTEQLETAVKLWFAERKDSNQYIINSYPKNYQGPMIGHFTVMVADRNTHVGCAAATYNDHNGYPNYLVACNYATTNMIDHPIYTGCGASNPKCASKNPRYPNLCSEDEHYDVNKWY